MLKREGMTRNRRVSHIPPPTITPKPKTESEEFEFALYAPSFNDNILKIITVYNNFDLLTEIRLDRLKEVPRELVKIITVIAPCYRHLTKITIQRCPIDMYVVYELSKMLKTSTITDVSLDNCPINGADYTLLLNTTKLKYLSLVRCGIDDEICEQIASRIRFREPAQNIAVLNLLSNRISDVGAQQIGLSLRSNRRLRYLNLADNHITDKGAASIFDALIEFQLTYEEIFETRKATIEYLLQKKEIQAKFLAQLDNDSLENISIVSRKMLKKKKTSTTSLKSKTPPSSARKDKLKSVSTIVQSDYITTKAEIMAIDELGPFFDPFQMQYLKIRDDNKYCLGNLTLAYLNLSYNNLSYLSVRKLENVVAYQKLNKKSNQTALIKIIIDGNNLPVNCPQYENISNTLRRPLRSRTVSEIVGRKARSKETAE